MPKRRPYRETVVKELEDTETEYVKAQRVPEGWLLYVVSAALEDEDNEPDQVAFGIMVGTRFEAMEETSSPEAGVRWNTVNTHHFYPLERPTFRVEGGTSGNTLRGILEGYMQKEE